MCTYGYVKCVTCGKTHNKNGTPVTRKQVPCSQDPRAPCKGPVFDEGYTGFQDECDTCEKKREKKDGCCVVM